MPGGASELRVVGVILRRLLQQAAATMMVVCRRVYQQMSGKLRQRLDLESRTYTKRFVLTCTSLVGGMQETFQSMPFDRAVFENVPSITLQPKSAWCVLFGGREGMAVSWGCGMCVGPLCFKGSRHAKPHLHLSRNLQHLSCHVHHTD